MLHKPERSYQQLLERIEQLESMFGCDDRTLTMLIDKFDFTGTQARVAAMLYRRDQVNRDQIFCMLYEALPDVDQPKPKIVDIHISRVRSRFLECGVEIINDHGIGWRLSVAMKAKLKALLDDYASELLAEIPNDLPHRAEISSLITALVKIVRYKAQP